MFTISSSAYRLDFAWQEKINICLKAKNSNVCTWATMASR